MSGLGRSCRAKKITSCGKAIAREITERKQVEEALERYTAMGRTAAVLAHEIHNLLEAVTNTFYLLRKHPSLDEEGRE